MIRERETRNAKILDPSNALPSAMLLGTETAARRIRWLKP